MQAQTIVVQDYVTISSAPTASAHAVRKIDLDTAIAGITGAGPLTSTDTNSFDFTTAGMNVTGSVRRKLTGLSTAQGIIDETADGIVVRLGATVDSAAPGNHGHPLATTSVPGFFSDTDKAKLDSIVVGNLITTANVAASHGHAAVTSTTNGFMTPALLAQLNALGNTTTAGIIDAIGGALLDSGTIDFTHVAGTSLTAAVRVKSASFTSTEGALLLTSGGLVGKLGTGANDLAAGNHAHADATGSVAGFLPAAGKTAYDLVVTEAVRSVTHVGAGGVAVAGTATAPTIAVDKTQDFTWTGNHIFSVGLTAQISGVAVLDSDNHRLSRATGTEAIDWSNSRLKDTAAAVALDWQAKEIHASFIGATAGNRALVSSGKIVTRATHRGAWATSTAYITGDTFTDSGVLYVALADHTSTSISADVASAKLIRDGGPVPTVAFVRQTVAVPANAALLAVTFPSGHDFGNLVGVIIEKLNVSDPEELGVSDIAQISGGLQVEFTGAPTAANKFTLHANFLKVT